MSIGYVAIKTKAREYLIFVETMWLQIKKQKIYNTHREHLLIKTVDCNSISRKGLWSSITVLYMFKKVKERLNALSRELEDLTIIQIERLKRNNYNVWDKTYTR